MERQVPQIINKDNNLDGEAKLNGWVCKWQ